MATRTAFLTDTTAATDWDEAVVPNLMNAQPNMIDLIVGLVDLDPYETATVADLNDLLVRVKDVLACVFLIGDGDVV